MRNHSVAAAVAAALGIASGGVALAAGPTWTNTTVIAHSVHIAGSSAAANSLVAYLEGTVCSGAWSQFQTSTAVVNNPDFRAILCTPAAGQPFAGTLSAFWYRPEGGSVVGVLPLVNTIKIAQLDPPNAACVDIGDVGATSSYTCVVGGTAPVNGLNDSWTSGVKPAFVDIGISDLEPGVFGQPGIGATNSWGGGGNNDPVGVYAAAFTGPDQGVDALQGSTAPVVLNHTTIFQQTFGFFVASSLGITDLPREQVRAIFDLKVADWHKVTTANNTAVTVGATAINVCNREIGSGSRAATDIYLNEDGCNTVGTVGGIPESSVADNFQTAAELDCVNNTSGTTPNAIGYASVDNASKVGVGKTFPNVAIISVSESGIVPPVVAAPVTAAELVQAAGTGAYGDVYEASMNWVASSIDADGLAFLNIVKPRFQAVGTTSNGAQILAIPGQPVGNTASTPLQVGAPSGTKTSDFTRGGGTGNSCTPLTHG
jgi:hypothetical protein